MKKAYRIFVALSLIFLGYTATEKALGIGEFQMSIANTGLFSLAVEEFLSYFIIAWEYAVILALLLSRRWGMWALFSIFAIFTLYLCLLFSIDKYEICGCGGFLNGLEFGWHLLINLAFSTGALFFIFKDHKLKINKL